MAVVSRTPAGVRISTVIGAIVPSSSLDQVGCATNASDFRGCGDIVSRQPKNDRREIPSPQCH